MIETISIQNIQFKRGKHATLVRELVNDKILKAGEPAYETDTGKLKIGDGIHNYADLAYINVSVEELNRAVAAAQAAERGANTAANNANTYSVDARQAAAQAEHAEQVVKDIPNQVEEYIEHKFWYGTLEEYNELVEHGEIDPDSFYFVKNA